MMWKNKAEPEGHLSQDYCRQSREINTARERLVLLAHHLLWGGAAPKAIQREPIGFCN